MSNYVIPQALIFQEFQAASSDLGPVLSACIVGPNYQLVTTAADGALGTYNPSAETCYSWPDRAAGAVVDMDSVRVYITDALLQYFYNPATGSDTIEATYCEPVDVMGDDEVKNAIHATATNWKTYGAYARAAALKERDVQVGDIVKVEATVDAVLVTLWTYVAGFLNDKLDGSVATATEDANNASAEVEGSSSLSPSASSTKIGYSTVTTDITAISAPNHPEQCFIDGVADDEYTITVTQSGEPADARLSIVSASGTDDEYDVVPSAWGVATAFGNKGLSVTFTRTGTDAFTAGMQWIVDVQFGVSDVDPVSDGDYTGPADTTYVVTVSTGGEFGGASGNPYVTISSSTGIDSSGPVEVTGLDTPVAVGSYGVTIEFSSAGGYQQGLYAGDRYYIAVTAPAAGPVRTMLLGHNLPDALIGLDTDGVCGTAPALAVTLYIKKTVEIPEDRQGYAPLTNWSASATQICLEDGILAYDASWVDSLGTLLPLPVKSGAAYTTYKALRTASANVIGSISSADAIEATIGSAVSDDNPLAMGVYFALLNSGGQDVVYVSVATDDLAGYTAAFAQLKKRDDIHGIVPMTFNVTIHDAAKAAVTAMSTPESGRWRRALVCAQLAEESVIVNSTDNSGSSVLATIEDDPSSSGTQYTLVNITSSVDVATLGAKAGDILRSEYTTDGFGNVSYSEYTIDAVLAEDSLRLLSGPSAPITVASKVEIWRSLATSEQATAVAALSGHYSDRRVTNMWPDYFEYSAESLPGYYLAAAYAGLRSGVVPQRGLTNTAVTGPTSVDRTTEKFTEDQLDVMAGGGTCIVTKDASGSIYVRHALTTDMTDINTKEEVVTANVDSISYVILEQVAPFIGVANLTEETIEQIRVELDSAIDYLRDNSSSVLVGGQLIDGEIVSLQRHPVLQDRLVATLDLTIPYPLNNIEVHLVI